MKKRLLILMLASVMTFSSIATSVLAADEADNYVEENYAMDEEENSFEVSEETLIDDVAESNEEIPVEDTVETNDDEAVLVDDATNEDADVNNDEVAEADFVEEENDDSESISENEVFEMDLSENVDLEDDIVFTIDGKNYFIAEALSSQSTKDLTIYYFDNYETAIISGVYSKENDYMLSERFPALQKVTRLNVKDMDISDESSLEYLFYNFRMLEMVNLSDMKTGHVTNMTGMFAYCSSINDLDMSEINMTNVKDAEYMFYGCNELENLITPEDVKITVDLPNDFYNGEDEFDSLPEHSKKLVTDKDISLNTSYSDIALAARTYMDRSINISASGRVSFVVAGVKPYGRSSSMNIKLDIYDNNNRQVYSKSNILVYGNNASANVNIPIDLSKGQYTLRVTNMSDCNMRNISYAVYVNTSLNGVSKGTDGNFYYYKNGLVNTSATGMASYNNGWYYFKNGVFNKYTGMVKHNGNWYYITNGYLKWGVNGMCNYGGTWYLIKNSTFNNTYSGMYKWNGKWYYISNGVLKWGVNGMCNYGGTWYYIQNSTYTGNYTGLVPFNGGWYYVQDSVLIWGRDTCVQYGDKWYYVRNSKVDFSYTGIVGYNGKTYRVKNGVVQF